MHYVRNAFDKNMSTDIKLPKTQISKIIKSGGFLGLLLSKIADIFMNVAFPLEKNILTPLAITAAASAIDAGIQKKVHGSGTKTLIISNEGINDIMKNFQPLKDSNILLKVIPKTIENERKKRKGKLLGLLLGTLGARLLETC